MDKTQVIRWFQMPWYYIKFNPKNSINIFPSFPSHIESVHKVPSYISFKDYCKGRSYADCGVKVSDLHKNAMSPNVGYVPYKYKKDKDTDMSYLKNVTAGFPSLSYPINTHNNYDGFLLWNGDDTLDESGDLSIYSSSIALFDTGKVGCDGWGQVGPTQVIDPIVYYTDPVSHKTFVLLVDKTVNNKQMRMIAGGGIIDSNENIHHASEREIMEEALKGIPCDELKIPIYNSKVVYCGIMLSTRNTNTSWAETIALSIPIPAHVAKKMELKSDETEDATRPHWFPTSDLETSNVNDKHQVLIRRAIRRKVRYVQFPEIFWSKDTLMKFRAVLRNQGEYPINPNWGKIYGYDEKTVFIAGPTDFDRASLWERVESKVSYETNLVIIDPINRQLHDENPNLCRALEYSHLMDKNTYVIFVLPKDLVPGITFDEMDLMVEQECVDRCMVFIQEGFPKELEDKIPSALIGVSTTYNDVTDIDDYLVSLT